MIIIAEEIINLSFLLLEILNNTFLKNWLFLINIDIKIMNNKEYKKYQNY